MKANGTLLKSKFKLCTECYVWKKAKDGSKKHKPAKAIHLKNDINS
jgi:hypothetical protein